MAAERKLDTTAELERLRAENEALRQQVEQAAAVSSSRSARVRNGSAIALMLVGTLLLALAIPAIWVNRMVTSTDYYVSTVSPLARDVAIQDAVASAASGAVIERLDLGSRLESRLPTDLAFLAAPIANAADGFVRDQTTAFVRSDAFPKIWDQANEASHKMFVAAITGNQGGAVQVEAGTITLDIGILAEKIVERIGDRGFGLLERVPGSRLDKTITLYQSDTLAQAAGAVDALQRTALVLPLLGLALGAGAIALAEDRRRALLWFGWGLLAWTLVPLQAIYLGQSVVGAKLQALASVPTAAAQNAYAIIFSDLIRAEVLFVALSVLVVVAALLAGPSKWATALRMAMSGGLADASSHMDFGTFGAWVAPRMKVLRVAGYVLAAFLLVALPRPRTIAQLLWIAAFAVLWVLAVQFLGLGALRRADEDSAGPNGLDEPVATADPQVDA